MSMFDVAKFLYFSRSIDLSREENRYFNLNLVGTVGRHSCMDVKPANSLLSPACVREKTVERELVVNRKAR